MLNLSFLLEIMKATFLLISTNLAIMAVLAIIVRIFNLDGFLQENGFSLIELLLFAAIYGFAGSFISLFLSKNLAKKQMGVRLIDDKSHNPTERWLYETVKTQAKKAGIGMPEVGIFNHNAPNAFATGHNRNASLVAVSTGLLNHMQKNEIEAVLGHEVAHIQNGDMVTSTLIQGTLNTFVIFFARLISHVIAARGNNQKNAQQSYFLTNMVLQTVFGVLASLIVFWHSRHREFAADRGGATLSSKTNMIAALKRLQQAQNQGAKGALADDFKAFGIVPLNGLFATHPPLEKRIKALEENTAL